MSFGGEIHLPIIHAAPASMMGSGRPIRTASIVACVKNAIRVAAANGIKKIGMPFLGSGIFSKRILEYVDMDDNLRLARLAKLLIKSCKNSRDVSVCFFPWSEQELSYFDGRIATFFNKRAPGVLQGSLLYNTQNPSQPIQAIVNAANTELVFGGGVSGSIGNATGNPSIITDWLHKTAREFNQSLLRAQSYV
jgi:hypothetical protein